MEINEEVRLLRVIVQALHEMMGSIYCKVSCWSQEDCQRIWDNSKLAIDQLLADDAKLKGEAAEHHDPADIERLARELRQVWLTGFEEWMPSNDEIFRHRAYGGQWLSVARHVRGMIDKAVEEEAEKAIRINDNWIKTSQQIVDKLNADHALALKVAKREGMVEVRGAFKNGTYTAQFIQIYIDRLISKLDGEGGE